MDETFNLMILDIINDDNNSIYKYIELSKFIFGDKIFFSKNRWYIYLNKILIVTNYIFICNIIIDIIRVSFEQFSIYLIKLLKQKCFSNLECFNIIVKINYKHDNINNWIIINKKLFCKAFNKKYSDKLVLLK